MSDLLPAEPYFSPNGRLLAEEPLEFWLPALEYVQQRHRLPSGQWRRFAAGKNAVFALDKLYAVKLIPPMWQIEAGYEAAALDVAEAGLRLATPRLLAVENLNGWTALAFRYVGGRPLNILWPVLTRRERAGLAFQLGEVAAQLHRLKVAEPERLRFDWPGLLAAQRRDVMNNLQGAAPRQLVESVAAFLEEAEPLIIPGAPEVLLHGDLSAANVMVHQRAGVWHITGLVDFGDASLGQAIHDFLSPNVNTFQCDQPVIKAFFDGYGLPVAGRTSRLRCQLMARTVLWYPWPELEHRLKGTFTGSWQAVAETFWPI